MTLHVSIYTDDEYVSPFTVSGVEGDRKEAADWVKVVLGHDIMPLVIRGADHTVIVPTREVKSVIIRDEPAGF